MEIITINLQIKLFFCVAKKNESKIAIKCELYIDVFKQIMSLSNSQRDLIKQIFNLERMFQVNKNKVDVNLVKCIMRYTFFEPCKNFVHKDHLGDIECRRCGADCMQFEESTYMLKCGCGGWQPLSSCSEYHLQQDKHEETVYCAVCSSYYCVECYWHIAHHCHRG